MTLPGPAREIIVEPLETPPIPATPATPEREREPEHERMVVPEREPEKVSA